jgi:hypothetical protein
MKSILIVLLFGLFQVKVYSKQVYGIGSIYSTPNNMNSAIRYHKTSCLLQSHGLSYNYYLSGTKVAFKGTLNKNNLSNAAFKMLEQEIPKSTLIKPIIFILQYCEYPSVSLQTVQIAIRELPSYLKTCSKNKFVIEKSLIYGPIVVPCLPLCDLNSLYELVKYAENIAIGNNVSLLEYNHRMIILPNGNSCTWTGLGNIGCNEICYSWFNGDKGTLPEVFIHELGHNFGLYHSRNLYDEYGDDSCVMGYCCGRKCYNAPQSWRLSITEPLYNISIVDMPKGIWQKYTIFNHLSPSKNSFMMLTKPNVKKALFISYVSNKFSFSKYPDTILIHTFGMQKDTENIPSILQAISKGTYYIVPEYDVTIVFLTSLNLEQADILVSI